MKNRLIIAHRGYSDKYPENTILAFEKAMEAGADMIELDVHLTKDAKLIVTHDALLGRTIQKTGNVWDYSLQELQSFEAGSWKGKEFVNSFVPSLDQVLELCKNKIQVNIEIKKETMHSLPLYKLMLETLIKTISAHKMNEQLLISSFDPFFLSLMKETKNLRKGLINGFPQLDTCLGFCETHCLYSYHPNAEFLTEEMIREHKKSGIKVFSWTAKTLDDFAKLEELQVDGIISNIIP